MYGFANGDPINFSDPFGLSADVVYQNEQLKALFDDLRKESAAFDAQLTSMEKSSVTTTVTEGASFKGTAVFGGAVFLGESSGGRLQSQTLVINSGSMASARRLFDSSQGVPLDIKDVVGHEVGHAGANARTKTWGACPDGPSGTMTCSVSAENAVRRDRVRTQRHWY